MASFVQVQSLLKNPIFTGSSFLYRCKNWQTKPWSNSVDTTLSPKRQFDFKYWGESENGRRIIYRKGKGIICNGFLLPVDPWAPNIDSQSIASQLFAVSLFPYLGFLYFLTKSKSAPKLTLFGFYFLLAFVGATMDPWAPNIDSQSIASQLFAVSLFPYLGFLYFLTKSKSAPKLTLFGFYFLLAFVGATIPAGIYAKIHYGTSLSNVDWLHGGAESLLTLTNLFIVLGLRDALRKATDKNGNASDFASEVKEEEKSSI